MYEDKRREKRAERTFFFFSDSYDDLQSTSSHYLDKSDVYMTRTGRFICVEFFPPGGQNLLFAHSSPDFSGFHGTLTPRENIRLVQIIARTRRSSM